MIVQLLWRVVACCVVCMHVLLCTWCFAELVRVHACAFACTVCAAVVLCCVSVVLSNVLLR